MLVGVQWQEKRKEMKVCVTSMILECSDSILEGSLFSAQTPRAGPKTKSKSCSTHTTGFPARKLWKLPLSPSPHPGQLPTLLEDAGLGREGT